MAKQNKNSLPDMKTDFSGWYNEVIAQAELVDQSPTRGCVVLRPNGYAIWEAIKEILDKKIKEHDVQNCYFPLLIPESFITKEADHVEGFSPELAVVTHAGGKKLEEPYVVRPTSETIVYHMFSRWINSWRDLPLQINQWANVVRWEMRTRPFLRTAEFLWQEGHTAHTSREEANEMALKMREVYIDLIENYLAVPVIKGTKTPKERFAGADETYTMEAMMPDGKALQMGTSHLLAHSFPAAYGVQFQNESGEMETPWCTSWGVTTRMIGALIMTHGDEYGLILPPKIAPTQVILIPIFRTDEERELVLGKLAEIEANLKTAGIRVSKDLSEGRPGAKFFAWEKKGVPVRIEIGPRDLGSDQVMLAARYSRDPEHKKGLIGIDEIVPAVQGKLEQIHDELYDRAHEMRESQMHMGEDLKTFGPQLEKEAGFYTSGWCKSAECEAELARYKADIRCIITEHAHENCFACQKRASCAVVIAKSY